MSYSELCSVQVGQVHGGLMGVLQRAMVRACPHIWFERAEMKDRHLVTKRSATLHCSLFFRLSFTTHFSHQLPWAITSGLLSRVSPCCHWSMYRFRTLWLTSDLHTFGFHSNPTAQSWKTWHCQNFDFVCLIELIPSQILRVLGKYKVEVKWDLKAVQ